VSHATRGSEIMSHIRVRFEGVWAHLALRTRVGVCFEGLASASEISSGCPRVATMFFIRCMTVGLGGLIRVRIGSECLTGCCSVACGGALPYSIHRYDRFPEGKARTS